MEVFIYLQPYLSKYLNVMVLVVFVQIKYTSFNFKFGAKSNVKPPKIYICVSKNKSKTMKKAGVKTDMDDEYIFHTSCLSHILS